MNRHAIVILWAQWRNLRNYYLRGHAGGAVFSLIMGLLWYGIWALAGFGAYLLAADAEGPFLTTALPAALLVVFLYWQLFPVLMASTGAFLDLRRVLVYPVPHGQLFAVEVLLRVSTGVEMLLVLAGITAGLLANPLVPFWAPLYFLPYILFNLFLSAGVKQVLTRLFERKWAREIGMVAFVALVALPQVLASTGVPEPLRRMFRASGGVGVIFPWSAAGVSAAGSPSLAAAAVTLGWMAAAYWFGRRQFERSLRLDDQPAASATGEAVEAAAAARPSWRDRFYRIPALFWSDPMAALMERELRTLFRSPRFRLILLLGCTLGQLVWLPQSFGRHGSPTGVIATNYLTFSSMYALLILGDNLFWNSLGFDRSAAQLYFVAPVRFSTVMIAKNLVALFFVLLEVSVITFLCLLLRLPVTAEKILEAYAVTIVYALFMLSLGNLASVYQPRPVSPGQAWRSSSPGKVQASLLLLYPVLSLPLLLAYGARYAFESDLAFYGVIGFDALFACVVYWVALDSSVEAVGHRKEQLLASLASGDGPVSAA